MPDDEVLHLGALLYALRERKGLTHREVREVLAVSPAYTYWLERIESAPSPRLLEEMLDLYGATAEERLLAYRLRAASPGRKLRTNSGNSEADGPPPEDHEDETPTQLVEVPETRKGVA